MRVVVFLDLDDSLFQTRPKCPAGETLVPGALGRDGEPLSFMTPRQERLLELLRAATIIPTTARNLDAFRRVAVPFYGLAILDFGGVILLPDGTLDRDWDAFIRPRALEAGAELEQIRASMQTFSDRYRLGVRIRTIHDFGMPLYVVAKHPASDVSTLERLRIEAFVGLDPQRFFVHSNDNNLSLVPRFLGKEHAVRYLRDHRLGSDPVLTIGIGDSLTDAAFLGLCDFALLPAASQLMLRLLS